MKSLFIFLCLLLILAYNIEAQTFSFSRTSPEFVVGPAQQYEIVSIGRIVNLTSGSFQIRIIRTNVNVPSGWETAICDIVACYPPEVDSAVALYPPGNNDISCHFYMDSIPGTGTMTIRAEKVSDPSENYSVVFGAIATPIGIKQISSTVNEFSLSQNYPNPFNPLTKIKFSIDKGDYVDLRIYDILGREVKVLISQSMSAGEYEVEFEAFNMSSGFYYYRLKSGDNVSVKKMVLVK